MLVTPMVSATVDTGALRHNLQIVRRWAPRSRVMAVIKANAYGHGLIAVARALEAADAFAVARVDEGLTLRAAGIRSADGAARRRVRSRAARRRRRRALRARGAHARTDRAAARRPSRTQRFKVWLKLDSGMNRLGFKGAAFDAAHAALSALASVQSPVNLFTHLASADEPELPTTADQIARFVAATRAMPGERSIANSAGMLSFSEAQADWVRPGLLLYGVSPIRGCDRRGLRPASR